jgi:hypothetical protein
MLPNPPKAPTQGSFQRQRLIPIVGKLCIELRGGSFMRHYIRFTLATALWMGIAAWAYADNPAEQKEDQRSYVREYAFFALGILVGDVDARGTWQMGGGGEVVVFKGIGVGGEIGYFSPWGNLGEGIGLFSPDKSYHRGHRAATTFWASPAFLNPYSGKIQ